MKKTISLYLSLVSTSVFSQTVITDCDKLRDRELDLLACNIYHESRNQPNVGQVAIGFVTINRVDDHRFPNTMESVVWKKWAFSWTNDGRPDDVTDWSAWVNANQVASALLEIRGTNLYSILDVTSGAKWYHTKSITPNWADVENVSITLTDHIFYSEVLKK